MIKSFKTILAFAVSFSLFVTSSYADAIKKYATGEFSLSTLSKKDRIKELKFFQKAAKPFKGMEINVLLMSQVQFKVLDKSLGWMF